METQSVVHNHLVDTQTEVQDDMGQSDNEYDTLNYESEKYSDDEDENGTNTSDAIQVKRGITSEDVSETQEVPTAKRHRKSPNKRQNGSPDSQSQVDVSAAQELPIAKRPKNPPNKR